MYRQSEKKFVKQQYVHISPQYGELRPTNGWDRFTSLELPSEFQPDSRLPFIPAATSITGGQPDFVRCLAVSWAGTLYIHFQWLLPRDRILPGVKFTLRPSVVFYIASIPARHSSSGRQPNCCVVQGRELRNFRRGRHLYLAGWPSHWASAHILVYSYSLFKTIQS